MAEFVEGQVWIGKGADPEFRKVIRVLEDGTVLYVFRRGRAGRFSSAILSAPRASFGRGGFKKRET